MTICHSSLLDWMHTHRHTRQSLAEIATSYGAKISQDEVGRRIKSGRPMPSEVMLAWKSAFGWSFEKMTHLCLGGPEPRSARREITKEESEFLKAFDAFIEARK